MMEEINYEIKDDVYIAKQIETNQPIYQEKKKREK